MMCQRALWDKVKFLQILWGGGGQFYERYYLCKMAELFCFEDGTPSFHCGKGGLYSRVLTRVPMGKAPI